MPDDEPRGIKLGGNAGGGGEFRVPPTLLHSENVSQNALPLEFLCACCLKLLDSPMDKSPIMSSSCMSSRESWFVRFGDDNAVAGAGISKLPVLGRGSRSTSLSRTCLTTSASRRNSVSAGAPSSASAALIRAKVFVLGCDSNS